MATLHTKQSHLMMKDCNQGGKGTTMWRGAHCLCCGNRFDAFDRLNRHSLALIQDDDPAGGHILTFESLCQKHRCWNQSTDTRCRFG